MRFKRTFFLLGLLSIFFATTGHAVYKVKKKTVSPVEMQKTRTEKLRNGKIIAEVNFFKKGVWAKMEAVIEAPPEIVWKLFVQTNDWKKYHVRDSRALDPSLMEEASSAKSPEDIYTLLEERTFNPLSKRRVGGTWKAGAFQYYDLKWPLEDRWIVFESHHDESDIQKGVYRSSWTKAAGSVRHYEGSLTLEPFEGQKNQTRLTYYVESHLGGFVPKFLVRWAVNKSIPDVIKAIRKEAVSTLPGSSSGAPKSEPKPHREMSSDSQ